MSLNVASRVVVVGVQKAALVVRGHEVVAVHHSDRLPLMLVNCCEPRLWSSRHRGALSGHI
jgi:hypothetical protein